MLVGADDSNIALVEVARQRTLDVERRDRRAAPPERIGQCVGGRRLGAEAQDGEAIAKAVEQRTADLAILAKPQMRRAAARNATRPVVYEIVRRRCRAARDDDR